MNRLLRHQRAALALFIAFAVTGVGVALAAPESGDQPGVTVDLSPHPPYSGTQAVLVTGQGFQSGGTGVAGDVYQAAELPGGTTAVGLTPVPFSSNSQGTFQATVEVSPTFQASGAGGSNFTVDCAGSGVTCLVEATSNDGGLSARHAISFLSATTTTTTLPPSTTTTTTTTTTVPPTTTSTTTGPTTTTTVPSTTSTTVAPGTSTTVAPGTSTTIAPTTSTIVGPTTTTVVGPTTTSIVLPTTSTVFATTTTLGGTTTTTPTGGPAACDQYRTAQANVNTQINAAMAFIQQSGLSAPQRAAFLAQLEAARSAANAQFAQLLAGCPS